MSNRMISPQGLDELFWGRDHEDVNDRVKRLTMAVEARDFNADNFFQNCKTQFEGKSKIVVQNIEPFTSRLDRIAHLGNTKIWGHKCR